MDTSQDDGLATLRQAYIEAKDRYERLRARIEDGLRISKAALDSSYYRMQSAHLRLREAGEKPITARPRKSKLPQAATDTRSDASSGVAPR